MQDNVLRFPRAALAPTRHTKRRATYTLGVLAFAVAVGFFWGMALGVLA